MIVGLVNDGEINTEFLNLERDFDVYFPDNDYYNCNVFPIEWIEIFSMDQKSKEILNDENNDENQTR